MFLKRKIVVSDFEQTEKKELAFRRSFLDAHFSIYKKDIEYWYFDKIIPEINQLKNEKMDEKSKNLQLILDKLELRKKTLLETGSLFDLGSK